MICYRDLDFRATVARHIQQQLLTWCFLSPKGFPVIFHGVMGKDGRELNSPSFFNLTEIEVLLTYLKRLLEDHGKKGLPRISAEDIGIIAPYRKQVDLRGFSLFLWRWASLTRNLGVSNRLKKSDWLWRRTDCWAKSWILRVLRWAEPLRSAESQQQGGKCQIVWVLGFPPSGGVCGGVSRTREENHHDLYSSQFHQLRQDGPRLQHRVPVKWKGEEMLSIQFHLFSHLCFTSLHICILEVQRGHNKSQVPAHSRGESFDPQNQSSLGKVRPTCVWIDILTS